MIEEVVAAGDLAEHPPDAVFRFVDRERHRISSFG